MEPRAKRKPAACEHCRQDIIRDCSVCMYPGNNGRCLYDAIKELVTAGYWAGLGIDKMIELLNTGMSMPDLIKYIESRMAGERRSI